MANPNPRFVVSYDLLSPGQDYESLINAIERLGGKKILDSQWCLRSSLSAAQIRDHLWNYMEPRDRLLVNSTDKSDWAAMNMANRISDI